MNVTAVLIALLTLCAGLALGWLLARQRAEATHREQLDQAQLAHHEAVTQLARVGAALESERSAAAAREALHARGNEQLREAFDSLAGEALRRNNEAFVAMAEARLGSAKVAADGALAQRQQAIEGMVAPMRESLEKVTQQLIAAERERTGSQSALLQQINTMRQSSDQLRSETASLVTALRAPQVRGRWGELQLERTVEAAGMIEHVDYDTQASVSTDDGIMRPDMVVRLVGGKSIVVDSKVAFAGYLEAMEAKDEVTRAARLKAHARHMRTHIDSLGGKAYWERFTPAPEFVVCFVPAEAFLDAALREDPTLLEHAFERNVVLATPTTLITLLRTVAYTWRQDALAANAAEVHQLGRELYQRLSTMGAHIDKLGRSLGGAVSAYNQTVSSLESRVLVTARRLTDLKVVDPNETLDPPKQITESARSTQAPELMDQRVVPIAKQRIGAGQIELTDLLPDVSQG
jgi:DNA recombination protein RmuC